MVIDRQCAIATIAVIAFSFIFIFIKIASSADAPAAAASYQTSSLVRLLPASPRQGETMAVLVDMPSAVIPPAVLFNKQSYKLFKTEGKRIEPQIEPKNTDDNTGDIATYRALIGVPADLKPGAEKLQVGDNTRLVTIKPGSFSVQRLHLPKEKDNFISSAGEESAVKQAKAVQTDQQLWQGVFHRPCSARVSTTFGQRRIVNGHLLTDYFHSGIDFAAAQGTPVKACQRGRVILAHSGWKLHGNTIAIDHGQGVISFYIHLSKIGVQTGDTVETGQVIGKVGMTGRASGPHLHFSLYVNGNATNPADWFAKAY